MSKKHGRIGLFSLVLLFGGRAVVGQQAEGQVPARSSAVDQPAADPQGAGAGKSAQHSDLSGDEEKGTAQAYNWPSGQLLPSFPKPAPIQELILFTRGDAEDKALFSSLKGIVNRTQPRIFSYEGDGNAEGPYTWLKSLGYSYREVSDDWALIGKYRNELKGVVVYDPALMDTLNLATTLAGPRQALVVSPSQVARLTGAPYNLPILVDLRGQFKNKLEVYQTIYDKYWPTLQHRILFSIDPHIAAAVREYATAVGGAAVWLDPKNSGEKALLDKFLSSMGPGNVVMGWWTSEQSGVTEASHWGMATVASDHSSNLTFHSGMPRAVTPKPTPPSPPLQNKIYVGFVYSDGDNLQYVEHLMRKLWNDPGRGKVPIGWTISPATLDAMPGALNFYWSTATANDELISGPSGFGYTYPNDWPSAKALDQFVATSADYDRRAGLRVVTIWNTITGGIDRNVGNAYAANAPLLLGVTAQNTGGGTTIYDKTMAAHALDCNYCGHPMDMLKAIAGASSGWNGKSPRFVLIQAQPWQGIEPKDFARVANALTGNYVVVRPDNFFQLLREANKLPADPVGSR